MSTIIHILWMCEWLIDRLTFYSISAVFQTYNDGKQWNIYECDLQRTLILTEIGSDVPTLFLARHCRVLLSLTETLLNVKWDSLPITSLSPKTDHSYPKMTSGFDLNTLHLIVNCSPGRTSTALEGSTDTIGLSNDDIQKNSYPSKFCFQTLFYLQLIKQI